MPVSKVKGSKRGRLVALALGLALLSGCENDKEQVGVYAFNMLYASEGPRYRIFRVTAPQLAQDGEVRRIDLTDPAVRDELTQALMSIGQSDALVGRDIEPVFADTQAQRLFSEREGHSPICNLYYFEGEPDGQRMAVSGYELMPKSPDCLEDWQAVE